jgi:hypothetical protein
MSFPRVTSSGIRLLLLGSFAAALVACEIDTRVSISKPRLPPTFHLSGSGKAGRFIVVGPYAKAEDLDSYTPDVDVTWELLSQSYGQRDFDEVPPITYGIVPRGFTQQKPASGAPPALEEGKFYKITAPSVNAGFRALCFKIEQASAMNVPCRER